MKITKNQLRRIIKEELSQALQEKWTDDAALGARYLMGLAKQAPEIYRSAQGYAVQPGDLAGGYDIERGKGAAADFEFARIEAERPAYEHWAKNNPGARSFEKYVYDRTGVDYYNQGFERDIEQDIGPGTVEGGPTYADDY